MSESRLVDATPIVSSFFVYGTLKRGERNDQIWPTEPTSICSAWTRGQLFGGVNYPAMTDGTDRVMGELWTFEPKDIDQVIQALDQLEGTNQVGQPDLYRRVVCTPYDLKDQPLPQAYLYLYESDPEQEGFTRILGPTVCWP